MSITDQELEDLLKDEPTQEELDSAMQGFLDSHVMPERTAPLPKPPTEDEEDAEYNDEDEESDSDVSSNADKLTLEICCDEDREISNPDLSALEKAVDDISKGMFSLILSRQDQNFIQVVYTGKTFYAEFRLDAETGSFCAKNLNQETAFDVLKHYALGWDFIGALDWEPSDADDNVAEDTESDVVFQSGLSGDFDKPFIFNDTDKPEEIKGYLGYYGLADWWLYNFPKEERYQVEEAEFNNSYLLNANEIAKWLFAENSEDDNRIEFDLDDDPNDEVYLTRGDPVDIKLPVWGYLCALAENVSDLPLKLKIADKAKELIDQCVLSCDLDKMAVPLNAEYQHLMGIYYRRRDEDANALANAIVCAESSIQIAPHAIPHYKKLLQGKLPVHEGFKQLAIIHDKQRNYAEAIRLCNEAMEQGWDGDWEKRIERYQKKLSKSAA